VRDSREEKVDVIAVALPLSAVQRIADILEQLSSTVADVCLTADLAGLTYRDDQFGAVGTNPVISIGEDPLKDWQVAYKACFDYVVSAIALVILSPLLALLALAIRLDSKGPILFRQPRLGFNNRMFNCYKFRTMYADKMDVLADCLTTRGDPRITRVGKWMRKFSLDELPQLINVLNGTMSLVGPRPHATNAKAADRLYAEVVQQYALRHRVKPGITGWPRSMAGAARRPQWSRSKTEYAAIFSTLTTGHFSSTYCCFDHSARDSQSARVLTVTTLRVSDDAAPAAAFRAQSISAWMESHRNCPSNRFTSCGASSCAQCEIPGSRSMRRSHT
jgi:lipopolysaccharide/colanic/teichoic acid biosynthesis glycosyltransferase